MAVTFNSFDIDDNVNYIVVSDDEPGQAEIILNATPTARRNGVQYLGSQYEAKVITIQGIAFADTIEEFNDAVDELKKQLNDGEQSLQFDSDRTYRAVLRRLTVEKEDVTTSPFTAEFLVKSGFADGSLLSVSLPVTSGVVTLSGTVTISGTASAMPVITYSAPGSTGQTTVNKITITHTETGKFITWSGTGSDRTVNYGGSVIFNYDELTVIRDGSLNDWVGIMDAWEPGTNHFVVSFQTSVQGGSVSFAYNPQYY